MIRASRNSFWDVTTCGKRRRRARRFSISARAPTRPRRCSANGTAKSSNVPAEPLPIAITMGDPTGIGPEIIVKLWSEGGPASAFVIGDAAILRRAVDLLGAAL